jgi:hypothetical protein
MRAACPWPARLSRQPQRLASGKYIPRDLAAPKSHAPLSPSAVGIGHDATGIVCVLGTRPSHYAGTTFWLAVDRRTERALRPSSDALTKA